MKIYLSKYWWLMCGIAGVIISIPLIQVFPMISIILLLPVTPILFLTRNGPAPLSLVIELAVPFMIGVTVGAIIRSLFFAKQKEKVIYAQVSGPETSVLYLPGILIAIQIILTLIYSYFFYIGRFDWTLVVTAVCLSLSIIISAINIILCIVRMFKTKIVKTRMVLALFVLLSAFLVWPENQHAIAEFVQPFLVATHFIKL